SVLAWTHWFDVSHTSDLRVGWSRERIWLPRPRSDIPILQSDSPALNPVSLPGSSRFSEQRENNNVVQVSEIVSLRHGRSSLSTGFQYRRNMSNGISVGLQSEALGGEARVFDGFYDFSSLESFGAGQPALFLVGVDRLS